MDDTMGGYTRGPRFVGQVEFKYFTSFNFLLSSCTKTAMCWDRGPSDSMTILSINVTVSNTLMKVWFENSRG